MIEFSSISFSYPSSPILFDQCSFLLGSNERVFIVGVNGSGKSTFLKLAARLLTPQKGKVIHHPGPEGKSVRLGFHQQDVHIAQRHPISVEEIVLMGRVEPKKFFFTKKDRQKVEECMEQTNVQNLAKKNLQTLSRGQYQRVLIARLLASEPDVIIMDEPEEFLDTLAREVLVSLVHTLSADITFLISSHNFDFIFSLANRVICITNPEMHREDHKFLDFLQRQNSSVEVEHLCAYEESIHA